MSSRSLTAAIRDVRALTGQTQRELAEAAGTSQSVVGRIESGVVSPTVQTLEHLVAAAGFELRTHLVPKRRRDPVVEAYKRDVDRTLLRANLRRSVEERLRMHDGLREQGAALQKGMAATRRRSKS
ncbi:MAG: helix-turn-helix domain-containing protein [Gemmatimonadota bacterium]|nr:helix-turn-helix domain-containing protein [Gemmatimonadota bacterium]